jgi:hypothetical protein
MTMNASLDLNSAMRLPQSLLIQLRAHYPASCLAAELVQVQDSHYIVRAMVTMEGQLLATALAAGSTVEAAEDGARQRVLDVLGIQALVLGETMKQEVNLRLNSPVAPVTNSTDIAQVPTAESEAFSPPEPTPTTVTKAKRRSPKANSAPEIEDNVPEAPLEGVSEIEISGGDDTSYEAEFEYSFEEEPSAEPAAIKPTAAMPVPQMDLSDAIAQIGAEIDRIGWTKKQGSTYLQETYSKRTRAELSDAELFEFLAYLKSLPAKVQPVLADLPF